MAETHWKKLTNPDFLGSWDFTKGEERSLTIARVNQQEVFNPSSSKKEMCMVGHFKENSKPMILNKTNCKMITKRSGTPYIEQWAGFGIVIGVDKVKAKGELVDALRIRDKAPAKTAPEKLAIICEDCKNPIQAFGEYSAEQIAAVNKKRYEVAVCVDCGNKRKGDGKENETNE